jgi:hypothetical protein
MVHSPSAARGRRILAAIASSVMLAGILVGAAQSPAAAAVTAVKGEACSYYVNVGLFGGPQTRKGCGGTTSRNVTGAATTNGSTTVTTSIASFTPEDVGAAITGTTGSFPNIVSRIPANTTIVSVANSTTITISAPATGTATGVTLGLTYATRPADPGFSPSVSLPPAGSGTPISQSDADGAKAQYGPAVIHGGLWPCEPVGTDPDGDGVTGNCPSVTPASGPQSASASGTAAGGTVTASADIGLLPTPLPVSCYPGWGPNPPSTSGCVSHGGYGPFPVSGETLHVECTANQSGVSGSTTLSKSTVAHSTDGEGEPLDEEPVPDNPPPNYTEQGVITNVGDVFTVVYNQQTINPDGSLTVIGTHMYLFGPTAIGEVIRGKVTCGTTPSAVTPSDNVAPTCGTPVVKPVSPEDQTPQVPRQELVGVFDAGTGSAPSGLTSITNIQVRNGSVQVGQPSGTFDYLKFTPGMVGPVALTARRFDKAEAANLPLAWSFDATDAAGNTTHCQGIVAPAPVPPTGITVFRPSNGVWYTQGGTSTAWGAEGDVPVKADYDGNGTSELAVFRPSNGVWYIQGGTSAGWGTNGDLPVPGDYDGDGKADLAVFRPSQGVWYINNSAAPDASIGWGTSGDIPVPGDYNGDGVTEIAVFRPSNGVWYVQGGASVGWGTSGDRPIPLPSAVRQVFFP